MDGQGIDDLADLAERVAGVYADRFGVPRTADWALMKLAEEQGELVGAWLAERGQSRRPADTAALAAEAADVLGFLLLFCRRSGIDPAAALRAKWGAHLPHG